MSGSRKHRVETLVPREDMAAWLHGVADAVAAGELPQNGGAVCLEGCRSLKISLKDDGLQMRAKISIRFSREAAPARQGCPVAKPSGEELRPQYKALKKHMKQTFKSIGQALAVSALPADLEAQSFVVDAKLMVTYAGKGDAFYSVFLEKVEAFEAALAARNVEAAAALHREISGIKRECHGRHA